MKPTLFILAAVTAVSNSLTDSVLQAKQSWTIPYMMPYAPDSAK